MMNTPNKHLEPAFEFDGSKSSVLLHQGSGKIILEGNSYNGKVEVRLNLLQRGGINFSGKFQGVPTSEILMLTLGQKTLSYLSVDNYQIDGFGSFGGNLVAKELNVNWYPSREPVFGIGDESTEISHIIFHLFNFIDFFDTTRIGQQNGSVSEQVFQHLKLDYEGWEVEIDPSPTMTDNIKALKAEGGYRITHIGSLEKADRTSFSGKDAAFYLARLGLFLSFVKGCWCEPICAVGYDSSDHKVWQSWSHPREPWQSPSSWFDPHHSSQMALLFPTFMSRLATSDWNDALHEVIYWYLNANHDSRGIDAGIILSQTAIERLSYEIAVKDRKLLSKSGFNNLLASDKFRLLFSSFDIPLQIPGESIEIGKLALKMNWIDAAHALAEIRNSMVHPEHKLRRLSGALYFEAWNLSLWYVEMSILAICRYSGTYGNRLKQRRMGQIEDVPWKK